LAEGRTTDKEEQTMDTYLVTGGAGFIGSNLVEELVRRNETVKVIDNFVTGKRENLAPFLNRIELIEGDIGDISLLRKVTGGVDYVLHQAALRSVPRSVDNPLAANEANVTGTLNVLLAAKEAGVKRLVYASSSSVYGDTPALPKVETQKPEPVSPYAVSKLTGEYYCTVFTKIYGLETACLRYFNVFGPRQSLESRYAVVIPKFISNILKDEPPPVHGDGEQSRDFTYIDNVVSANLLAANAETVQGEIFNVACGERFSVLDIVKQLNKILNKEVELEFVSPRPGDVRHTLADISKAQKLLNYRISVGFEEGLKKTVEWFKEYWSS